MMAKRVMRVATYLAGYLQHRRVFAVEVQIEWSAWHHGQFHLCRQAVRWMVSFRLCAACQYRMLEGFRSIRDFSSSQLE